MALFQVDGWNLDSVSVKKGGQSSKKENKKKSKKEKKEKKEKTVKKDEEEPAVEEEDEAQEQRPEKNEQTLATKETVASKKPKVEKEGKEVTKKRALEEEPKPSLDVPKTKLTPLQQKMMAKLTGSRFRWINEQLYTITSDEALKLIQEQPQLFDEYHDGFRSQVQSWPENPVDIFVQQIKERGQKPVNAPGGLPGLKNKKIVIADMGCGEAQFSLDIANFLKEISQPKKKLKGGYKYNQRLDIEVHSFDLKKANDRITVADIRHVPLPDQSCTIVIFCLALMGTNFLDFIKEADRILAPRGEIWIAEIKSRFSDTTGEEFEEVMKLQGFFHKKTDNSNKMFTRFEFFKAPPDILAERKAKLERKKKFIEHEDKVEQLEKKREKIPEGKWLLKPCIYKRR